MDLSRSDIGTLTGTFLMAGGGMLVLSGITACIICAGIWILAGAVGGTACRWRDSVRTPFSVRAPRQQKLRG